MNRGILRGLMRNLLLERNGDNGLITDTEANELLNVAARMLATRVIAVAPEHFAFTPEKDTDYTVAIGGNPPVVYFEDILADLALASGAEIAKVMVVKVRLDTPPVGVTSATVSLPEIDIDKAGLYENWGFPNTYLPFRYYVSTDAVRFVPSTIAPYQAEFVVSVVPPPMTQDSDEAWSGKLLHLHDTIAVLASMMAIGKEDPAVGLKPVFTYIDSVIERLEGKREP